VVLITSLKAMELLRVNQAGALELTDIARNHLLPEGDFFMGDYLGLASSSDGVLRMVELLQSNRPLGSDDDSGVAFIYREGERSAMESEALARHFTLSLSGRAKNVAPHLAKAVPMDGPLSIALYSVLLFSVTEGRAYSAGEHRAMFCEAGLSVDGAVVNTLVHCGVLTKIKPS